MNTQNQLSWRTGIKLLTGIITVVLGAALAWQAINIYLFGVSSENLVGGVYLSPVYSREIVGENLSRLGIPALLWLVLIVVTAITSQPSKGFAAVDPEYTLSRMKKRIDTLPDAAEKEEKQRRNALYAEIVVCLVCAVFSLLYLLNVAHFTSWDLETVMGQMLINVLPFVAVAFAAMCAKTVYCQKSCAKEIELLRSCPKADKKAPKQDFKGKTVLRIALYAIAVLFVVLGILNQGMRDVLVKAINICTECIGLG